MNFKQTLILTASILLVGSAVLARTSQSDATPETVSLRPASLTVIPGPIWPTVPTTTAPPTTTTVAANPAPDPAPVHTKPATKSAPSRQVAPSKGTGYVQDLIISIWGPYAQKALAVAKCESTFNPRATNGSIVGVFQLHPSHTGLANSMGYSWSQMYEAEPNIRVAFALFKQEGWGPWACA